MDFESLLRRAETGDLGRRALFGPAQGLSDPLLREPELLRDGPAVPQRTAGRRENLKFAASGPQCMGNSTGLIPSTLGARTMRVPVRDRGD